MAPCLAFFIAVLSASSVLSQRIPDCREGEIYVVHHGCVSPTSQEQQHDSSECPEGTVYSKFTNDCKVDGDSSVRMAHEIEMEQRIKRSYNLLNDQLCKQGYIWTEAGCVTYSTMTKPQFEPDDYEDRIASYGCSDGDVKGDKGCVKVSHVEKPDVEPDEFDDDSEFEDRIGDYGCVNGEMRTAKGCALISNATKSADEPDYEE